ncbi:cwf21 domain-containing protein [Cladochytrium replicatum]|nr:cwf21 domain-containing protein [Cladochytrium replicatum]
MYNGIGLSTTRGSGTNGYVQRNLSTLRSQPQRVEFSRDEKKGSERSFTERKPDPDILLHNKKRQIEVQCLELRDELEGQGLSESEIEDRIESLRTRLLNELVGGLSGTDNTNETHAMAEAKERQNVKLMQAFGIHEASYTEGAAFDRELQVL